MTSVTMSNITVVSSNASQVRVSIDGVSRTVTLAVQVYENGVLIHIPWLYRKQLGEPHYEAFKRVLRPHFEGLIQTRTETDPRFVRAAKARSESDETLQKSGLPAIAPQFS